MKRSKAVKVRVPVTSRFDPDRTWDVPILGTRQPRECTWCGAKHSPRVGCA